VTYIKRKSIKIKKKCDTVVGCTTRVGELKFKSNNKSLFSEKNTPQSGTCEGYNVLF